MSETLPPDPVAPQDECRVIADLAREHQASLRDTAAVAKDLTEAPEGPLGEPFRRFAARLDALLPGLETAAARLEQAAAIGAQDSPSGADLDLAETLIAEGQAAFREACRRGLAVPRSDQSQLDG